VVESHASVGVVLYHGGMGAFIIVRQFRPAVWISRSREAAARGLPPPPLAAGKQAGSRPGRWRWR
jgi:hypothetical protein